MHTGDGFPLMNLTRDCDSVFSCDVQENYNDINGIVGTGGTFFDVQGQKNNDTH